MHNHIINSANITNSPVKVTVLADKSNTSTNSDTATRACQTVLINRNWSTTCSL